MRPFDFKSGVGVSIRTAEELRAMSRELARLSSMFPQSGGSENVRTQERIIVKLTAQNGATPPVYSGTEQSFTIAGAYEDMPNGRTFSPTGMKIYERNGLTVSTFPFYAEIIRRVLVDGTPTYEFDIGQSGNAELKGLTFTSDTDSTADSDPGAGLFKWNNATQSNATVLYFDNATADAIASNVYFGALAGPGVGGSGTGFGFIYLQQSDDSTKWQLWQWSTITAGSGYYKFTVTLQAYGGAIADGKTVYTIFDGEPDAASTHGGRISGATQRLYGGRKDIEKVSINGAGLLTTGVGPFSANSIALSDVLETGPIYLGLRFGGSIVLTSLAETETSVIGGGDEIMTFTIVNGGTTGQAQVSGSGADPGIPSDGVLSSRKIFGREYYVGTGALSVATAGVTATLGPGAASTGGIITNGGSGTFFDPAAGDVTGSMAFSGDISPAQLTADVDNWNPTGW